MKPLREIVSIVSRTDGGKVLSTGPDGCAFVLGRLKVIVSTGGGWDHVSVSRADRTPRWEEMERVRALVTGPGEVWVQYGLPPSLHIDCHPYCLHWWRPQKEAVTMPPNEFV